MRYVLLIYADESKQPAEGSAAEQALMGEYFAYSAQVQASGRGGASEALYPVASATTVRVRNGERLVTDGPFAETKEQFGGFYIIDCEDLDEALDWAARIPSAREGSIEIRPLVDFSQVEMPGAAATASA